MTPYPHRNQEAYSESLREKHNSYVIQELFQQFPTLTELLEASDQQLTMIMGIGLGKTHQTTNLLLLAKALTSPYRKML